MPCFVTTAHSEVRLENGKITMHPDEYRFFITRIKTLEAEAASLKEMLVREREAFDELATKAMALEVAVEAEREAWGIRIRELEGTIKSNRASQWCPGVILGGGPSTGGGIQGVIGLGWKIGIR